MAAVRLAHDVKRPASEFRVELEEGQQRVVRVGRGRRVVGRKIWIAEADTRRLFEEQDVGQFVPRVWVEGHVAVHTHDERSELREHAAER